MFEKSIVLIHKAQLLIRKSLGAWALPFTCILCKRPSDRQQDLCWACLRSLPIITQKCVRCAAILLMDHLGEHPLICGTCLITPPPFNEVFCAFAYQEAVTAMIVGLKFQGQLAYARILGELMAEPLARRKKALPELILPIPLHPLRLKERGFNQAVEIARPIGRALGIPLELRALKRVKNTSAQMTLSAKERRQNIRGAFRVERSLAGKRVTLVDDVMTTGSTLREVADCLLRGGVREVEVWCAARALIK